MIAVIFEVWPASGRKDDYLAIAAALRADLERIDGFISVERFQSITDPNKLLSLSFWRDEDAVKQWRNLIEPPRQPGQGTVGHLRRLPAARRFGRARLRAHRSQ